MRFILYLVFGENSLFELNWLKILWNCETKNGSEKIDDHSRSKAVLQNAGPSVEINFPKVSVLLFSIVFIDSNLQ